MTKFDYEDLKSKDPKIKYGLQKKLLEISENRPHEIYQDFQTFVDLLDSNNHILEWTGILVIGNLACVDHENKIDKILYKINQKLNTGVMITAGNTCKALAKIAKAKPKLSNIIVLELLKADNYKYQTEECHNIIIGHIINAFCEISDHIKDKDSIEIFAQQAGTNSRPATAKKADKLLRILSRNL